MFWVVLVVLIIGAVSNAVMDKIRFHYSSSIFKNFSDDWWNPSNSWRNKWKNGNPEEGERFWGSSRWFVRFTDAWHFFQGVMFTCFFISIVLYERLVHWFVDFCILYIVFTSIFYIFYTYIFSSKK